MREPDLVTLNRNLTFTVLKLSGKPTLSTAAGNAIAESIGVRPRTGKKIFHGAVAAATAASLTDLLPPDARGLGALAIGVLTYLALESYDPSR